jgi:hypothetical protein
MACVFFFGKDQPCFLEELNPSRGAPHVRPLVNLIRWDRENAKATPNVIAKRPAVE